MKVENVDNWTSAPGNAAQTYCPTFRDKTNEQIMQAINPEKNWLPFGYDHFIICRPIGTVFIKRTQN